MARRIGTTPVSTSTNPKTPITNVMIVQDRSASMGPWHQNAVKEVNNQLETIKTAAAQNGQETYIGVNIFANHTTRQRPLRRSDLVSPILPGEYQSDGGSTSLRDAISYSIDDLENFARPRDSYADNAFLLVVVTDGQENSSRLTSQAELRAAIKRLSATDKWTFSILGPPGSRGSLEYLGFAPGNIREWEQSFRGFQEMAVASTAAYQGYFDSRKKGVTSTRQFFTTDLSNVTAADKRKLTLVSAREYRILTVDKESEVRPFVEEKTKEPYRLGSAYYLLTKREKIQDHKDLLIQDRATKEVFGDGEAIRDLLGFPRGTGLVTVDPGNHANWNLFVQSTSTNRKLVRGSVVLVAK